MPFISDLIDDSRELRTALSADLNVLIRRLWLVHARMEAGGRADDLQAFIEGMERALSEIRGIPAMSACLLSVAVFLDQMPLDFKLLRVDD